MDGTAVKLTMVPVQICPAGFAETRTAGVTFGFTCIAMVLDAAVAEVRQVPPLIVISQVTTSPLISVELLNDPNAPFCTLIPFTLKS